MSADTALRNEVLTLFGRKIRWYREISLSSFWMKEIFLFVKILLGGFLMEETNIPKVYDPQSFEKNGISIGKSINYSMLKWIRRKSRSALLCRRRM